MFGLNAAMLESFRLKSTKRAERPGHNEFIEKFYKSTFMSGAADSLGGIDLVLGIFASWFILHNNHDLAIESLDRLRSVSKSHGEEHQTYFSIFSHANVRNTPGGMNFFRKMKSHFGEMDWRTIYVLSSAISDMDRSAQGLVSQGSNEPTLDMNVDMWPIMQAWIKADIIHTSPDAGASIMAAQATRYSRTKEYDKAMTIAEYILNSHSEKKLHEKDSSAVSARILGAEIILSRKQYDQLRPYLKKYGGAPEATRAGSP
jgi:hypothetical protein